MYVMYNVILIDTENEIGKLSKVPTIASHSLGKA